MGWLETIGAGLVVVVGMILAALKFGERKGRDKEILFQQKQSYENERKRDNVEETIRRDIATADKPADKLHDKFYRD